MKQEKVVFLPNWLPLLIDGCPVEVYFPSAHAPENYTETNPDAIEQALMATYKKANHVEKIQ